MAWSRNKCESGSVQGNGPPLDVANLAYLIYFALGAGVLFPWNSFITAVDYFDYLYPNQHIDRVFSVAYIFPCLICLCMLTVYGHHFSTTVRVNLSMSMYLVALSLVPIIDAVYIEDGSRGSTGTYYGTVAALFVTGVSDAIMQGSLVGTAGELPERYMQAFVAGTAASGVIISALRIITKAVLPQTPSGLRASGNIYFAVSAAFLGFCLVCFNMLHKLPVIKHYRMQKLRSMQLGANREETEPLSAPEDAERTAVTIGVIEALRPSPAIKQVNELKTRKNPNHRHALMQVKWLAASMTSLYVITLSVFPGFLTEDVHSRFLGNWYPVLLLTSFNICDFVGKELTLVFIPHRTDVLTWSAVGRVLFIPLFAACVHGPSIFRTEAPVFLLTSLLGVTNGYLSSCFFILGPKIVPFAEAESAAIVITISLVVGLAIGSVVSWFWVV